MTNFTNDNSTGGSSTNQQILIATRDFTHVIWDWNGTLYDDVDVAVTAVNVMLKDHGLSTVDPNGYRECFGFPVRDYYQNLGFSFKHYSFETLCDRFMNEYASRCETHGRLFPGIADVLQQIKSSKTQSILSAAAQWHLDDMLERFQLHSYFDFRFGISDHYAASKLDRGRELISQSRIPASQTILIGDTDHDFEVAKELGISCLLIADGHQSLSRLEGLTDQVIFGRRSWPVGKA